MSDEKKRRPWTMSDAERDSAPTVRERRNAPPRGVVVQDDGGSFEQEDHFTPVSEVIERAADLTDRERTLLRYIWTHTANMELRARKRSDSSETSTLMKRLDAIEETLVETVGKSGNNGKVGTLKERVDKAEARRWWGITWIAGLAVAIVTAAVAIGSWKGSVDADVKTLKERVFRARNVSPPDYPASKEGTP